MKLLSSMRNDSSTAFFSHHAPSTCHRFFRNARRASVELINRFEDGLFHMRLDVARGDVGATFEGRFDGCLMSLMAVSVVQVI